MQGGCAPYLDLRDLPRDLSQSELLALLAFSRAERELVESRLGDHHKLGLRGC